MSYFDGITASLKVSYDKIYDYVVRSSTGAPTDDISDRMENYSSVIKIENYNSEDGHTRILEPVGLLTEYSTFFGPPTFIIDNIYLGSAHNAASYNLLKSLDIKIIINMTKEISNYFPDDFIYIQHELTDNNKERILDYLESTYNQILILQSSNILIHCYMGASRSASVVLYYLMRKYDYTFDDALAFIKEKRVVVNPTFRLAKDLAQSMISDSP